MDQRASVDGVLAELSNRWGFRAEVELPEGYCCRAFADADRVLRIPWQGEELTSGVTASYRMEGAGGPKVYRHDAKTGAMLMERLRPGTKLRESVSPEANGIEIAIGLIRRVRDLDPTGLPTLGEYYGYTNADSARLIASAPAGFLHGDLHQENILRDGDDWRPIDPKGLSGDPCFEPVAFIRNLLDDWPQVEDFGGYLGRAFDQFADELHLDRRRIMEWTYLDALDFTREIPGPDFRHEFRDLLCGMRDGRPVN